MNVSFRTGQVVEFYGCSCLLFFGGIEEKTFKAIGACCKALITKYPNEV